MQQIAATSDAPPGRCADRDEAIGVWYATLLKAAHGGRPDRVRQAVGRLAELGFTVKPIPGTGGFSLKAMHAPEIDDEQDEFRLEAIPENLVSSEKFRQRLGVSSKKFLLLIRHGDVPAPTLKIRGRRFWRAADVEHAAQALQGFASRGPP